MTLFRPLRPPLGAEPTGQGSRRQSLLAQIAWFNRLRMVVAASVLVLAFVSHQWLGALENPLPIYLLGSTTAVLDLVYIARFSRLAGVAEDAVRRHIDMQIVLDLVVLTALLHWSGGITNPLFLLAVLHAFIAALLRSARAAMWVGVAGYSMIASLGIAEFAGWIPHHPLALRLMDLKQIDAAGLALLLLTFGVTMLCSVYFVATVVARLRSREDQLGSLSRQLAQSEKLASVGTLAAGVSHEINNPTAVIKNKVQILRYRIGDGNEPALLSAELDVIDKHIGRIGAITAGLLTFSRETEFQRVPLDLNDLVREGVDLVRSPFQSSGVAIQMRLDPAGPRVSGSQNHLLQVLVNVLLNARDASPRGSQVVVSTLQRSGQAVLEIRDQGTGIPPEVLDKIFDPFFTTKDIDKGTGLGLAITHGIVERHGGEIGVASTTAEGTAFTISLPSPPGTSA